MAKRTRTLHRTPRASAGLPRRPSRPGIVHTSVCISPRLSMRALREAAFRESGAKSTIFSWRAIQMALQKRGWGGA